MYTTYRHTRRYKLGDLLLMPPHALALERCMLNSDEDFCTNSIYVHGHQTVVRVEASKADLFPTLRRSKPEPTETFTLGPLSTSIGNWVIDSDDDARTTAEKASANDRAESSVQQEIPRTCPPRFNYG
jgi:hypothetical protein